MSSALPPPNSPKSIIAPFSTGDSMSANLAPNPMVVRHRFSLDQYHEMIELGIFTEDEPIELIRGEVVRKMPIGNPHAATVKRLNRVLSSRLPVGALLSIQDPISTSHSEPEPDVAILVDREDLYASRRPTPQDVKLLIEVADSSLKYDRDIKGPVYAEAGIAEYWIVNLLNSTIEVYRDPQPDGRFASVLTLYAGQSLSPLLLAEITIHIDEILGSVPSS